MTPISKSFSKKLIHLGLIIPFSMILLILPGCGANNPTPPVAGNGFGTPIPVTISGYTGDAMEPFIDRDGKYLFFNSLNDSVDTCLYYAEKVSDANFLFKGKLIGVNNPLPPHLDAVASMDLGHRFYYISTRNYPGGAFGEGDYRSIYRGSFLSGAITNLLPVSGNFYTQEPGWIIMDAEISPDGNDLYYANAYFTGNPWPAKSDLGLAQINGADFNQVADVTELFKNINTSTNLEYAPSSASDQLELFFTRHTYRGYLYRQTRLNLRDIWTAGTTKSQRFRGSPLHIF
ncbi:MAG TPA: hypothetical protein VHY08_04490 [Bacillota bacterium]|nr:hypothetical protein [Bacillota bacterium]